jgi:hypothetical protein
MGKGGKVARYDFKREKGGGGRRKREGWVGGGKGRGLYGDVKVKGKFGGMERKQGKVYC